MISFYFSLVLSSSIPHMSDGETNHDKAGQNDMELIEVSGRKLDNLGRGMAGSSGTVGFDDLKNRPIARVGEILEVIPGMIATQHSGTGKANQYFVRGFNLDHGTDFATHVDGIPINMRSHGHGQGYTDLNILIPELVKRVDFKKGPYHADVGDFSSAGSAKITTYDSLDRPIVKATVGSYGFERALVAGSFDVAQYIHMLAAFENERYDGPFAVEEDLDKINGLIKFTGKLSDIKWGINLTAFDSNWNSADQIPLRAIQSGAIDRYGSLDPDLGGNTSRYSASTNITSENGNLSAYFIDYDFQLFSNFTYFTNAPIHVGTANIAASSGGQIVAHHAAPIFERPGDEFEQADNRQLYGADMDYRWSLGEANIADLQVGAGFRHDDIKNIGLHRTQARQRYLTIREDQVSQTSYSAFAKLQSQINNVRLEAGLRLDYMDASVTADRMVNSGSANDTIISPSFSVAAPLSKQIEFYANYGEGFHSNDARGATITQDPLSQDPVDQVPLLVKSRGAETGIRYETDRVKFSAVGFMLDLNSELVYVGDEGTVEAQGASRRYGFETTLSWQMTNWANLYTAYAYTHARFKDEVEDHIPNAVPSVFSAELKLTPLSDFTSSMIVRHAGSAPLIEDNSVRSNSTTTVNWGGFYQKGNVKLGLEILNVLNSRAADISYYFESRLADETAAVADIHAHPMVPRQVRLSVELSF